MKLTLPAVVTSLLLAMSLFAQAASPDLYTIPVKNIDGQDAPLKAHAGKVLLIVNVASECGYTKQYKGLQELWAKYKDQGLVVLGFPSNDFGGQEPGSNAEIKQFCETRFKVTFPMYDKVVVKGADQHPLYAALTGSSSPVPGPVKWNFGKFLIGRDGQIIARYDSGTEPMSDKLTSAVEAALKGK